jgi:hypothetical protein
VPVSGIGTNRAVVLVRAAVGHEACRELAAAVHRVELVRELAVPVDAEPRQRLLDLLDRLHHLTARVGVLDPEQALAALPRAKSQLNWKVWTPPMWRKPVGLGAMRTRTLIAPLA